MTITNRWAALIAIVVAAIGSVALGQGDLVQVQQDFAADPGWEGVNNRVECSDCPTITQDFGWSPGNRSGEGRGEIGGTVWQSRTPAYYAMPMGRSLNFKDAFSASGRIAVMPGGKSGSTHGAASGGSAYIGFFNAARQEWRPWSSLALRISPEGDNVTLGVDYMTARWNAGGCETDVLLPKDGKPHTWRLTYDPNATPREWTEPRLKGYLASSRRQTAEQIFEKAKAAEPGVTLKQIEARLSHALAGGSIETFRRPGGNPYRPGGIFFTLSDTSQDLKGVVTLQVDGGQLYKLWLPAEHRDAPVALDRFGLFNFQVYSGSTELYVSDLAVNGQKIDLASDPKWEGKGNRVTFVEREFQRQDFGYSQTHWAGDRIGEIGGLFSRTEPIDPLHGYYADDIGKLTLEDPFSFSGNIAFVNGGTDAGMFFGYFSSREKMKEIADEHGAPLNDSLGIDIDGPTRIGYYFTALCSPKRTVASAKEGPVFLPTGERRSFRLSYDPEANNGVGRMTVTLDEKTFTLDLKPEQRAAGATFDRFGIMNKRVGGKYVTLYFDDISYTARRPRGHPPVRHEQKTVTVPYPKGGRKY